MNFRVVDLEFPIPAETTGDAIFEHLERALPERVWIDQLIAPSWDSNTCRFQVTVFERGFEDRAAVVRCLNDMGFRLTETETWL